MFFRCRNSLIMRFVLRDYLINRIWETFLHNIRLALEYVLRYSYFKLVKADALFFSPCTHLYIFLVKIALF